MLVLSLFSTTVLADGNMGSGGLCQEGSGETKVIATEVRETSKWSGFLDYFGDYLKSMLDHTGGER